MIFSRKVLLLIICSISINNYSMHQDSLEIDFSQYVHAFLKDDNTLWFNFQNGIILEEKNQRARSVFRTLTKQQKPSDISFSSKTHANFEEIKSSDKTSSGGAQFIWLSKLKNFKVNSSCTDNNATYTDVVFNSQRFYMQPSFSKTIPSNTESLPENSGFFLYCKGKRVDFKRVKLFQVRKKITITKN